MVSKLLIVDDSDALLETLQFILERDGYEVRTLNNIATIYEEINKFQPHLLIIDICINGEDGREVCRELRKMIQNKDLYILVFSGFTQHLADYKSYHADDFIEKPFELKNLLEKIKSVIDPRFIPSGITLK